jgi:acetyl-CoA carboxylase carboxyltransferase component
MVRGHATAYLGSPRLAEMVTGEKVTLEEMGGAEMHCTVSGLGDCLVEDDTEALNALRLWLSFLPANWEGDAPVAPARPPSSTRALSHIVPLREQEIFDMEDFIDALVDEGSYFPYKELFAPEMITAFARLNGQPVGLVANQPKHLGGVLFPDSSDKAARFIWICNAYNVPLIFLSDIAGYMIGSAVERQGIIRHGAKMIFAVSESRVPRITVLVRKAYGGGYLAMSGAPMNPDALLALPTARPALMGPDAAVNGVYFNQIHAIEDEDEREAFIRDKLEEYAAGIDPFRIADANSVEAIVASDELREELTKRLYLYKKRDRVAVKRNQAITPV